METDEVNPIDRNIPDHAQWIWLDDYASLFGFDYVSSVLPGNVDPSYLLVGTTVLLDVTLLQLIKEMNGEVASFLENPFWLLVMGVFLLAVFGSKQLHMKYENAKIRLQLERRLSPDEYESFARLGSHRFRWAAVILGAALLVTNIVVVIGLDTVYRVDGASGLVGNLVFLPLVYVPAGVEFIVTYIAVQGIVPRRIERSNLGLDFLDPERMGGLRPLGELLKLSYYYVLLGFVSFALFTYAPFVFQDFLYAPYEPGPITNVIYTVGWLGSAVLLAYGLYVLHRFMSREKREELVRLDHEVKREIEEPWDVKHFTVPEESEKEYKDLRERMNHVTATNEYPATFAMWSQLLIGVFIPKAVQMTLNLA